MRSRALQVLAAVSWLAAGCNQAVSPGGTSGTSGSGGPGSSGGGGSTSAASTGSSGGSSSGASSSGSSGSTGGNGTGSTGGSSSGGGQAPLAAQLCSFAWQGFARVQLLTDATVLASTLHPPTGTYCPTPTPAQANAISLINAALSNEMLNLPPPDGGWPDGSGPTVCNDLGDTSNSAVELADGVAASLDAGRVQWDSNAAQACAQSMLQTDYLLDTLFDGGFANVTMVPSGPDGGPCVQILVGQVTLGNPCTFSFDCQSGLFCRPSSADGCGGTCATPIADGLTCGPYDACVSTDSCNDGTCTANSTSPPAGNGQAPAGAACTQASDCQPCLSCNTLSDGGLGCAVTTGLLGDTCQSDGDCTTPLLYCKNGTCAPSGVPGDTGCLPTSDNACLFGWCAPADAGAATGTCVGSSNLGGPCVDSHSCGTGYCGDGGGGLGVCTGDAEQGQSCAISPCDSNLYCDSNTQLCEPTLGGGAVCTDGTQCQSSSCLNGVCASPCVTGCGGNCLDGPGASLLLGLGGAMALQRRRRRKS